MIKSLHSIVIFALCCAPVFGQQRGQGRGNPAVRPSHVHNEGPFHMFIPITSPVEIFFGPEGQEERETVAPGQVHLFKSNTPHGFKNAGSTPVTFIEIFVKNTGRAANISPRVIETIQESALWLKKTDR